jgi:hypothetical protein
VSFGASHPENAAYDRKLEMIMALSQPPWGVAPCRSASMKLRGSVLGLRRTVGIKVAC